MAIDLAAAIAAQRAAWAAEQTAREAAQAAEDAAREEARAARRAALLQKYLGDALIAQLQVTLVDPAQHVYGFGYDGVAYRITVYAHNAELWAHGASSSVGFQTPEGFIVALATLHFTAQAERAAQAEREAQRAAQLATHARLQAQVDAAYEAAQAQRWQWPEGRELAVWRWHWCTAPAGQSGHHAEYDGGWGLSGRLRDDGLLVLECHRNQPERRLYLSPGCLPIAGVQVFPDMSYLPPDLREPETMTLFGLRYEHAIQDADGEPIIVEDADGTLLVYLGEQPLAWVRALLEA